MHAAITPLDANAVRVCNNRKCQERQPGREFGDSRIEFRKAAGDRSPTRSVQDPPLTEPVFLNQRDGRALLHISGAFTNPRTRTQRSASLSGKETGRAPPNFEMGAPCLFPEEDAPIDVPLCLAKVRRLRLYS